MKILLFFLSIGFIGFSQEKEVPNKTQPLFLSTINLDSSYVSKYNLNAVSNNIKTVSAILSNSDKINRRNFVTLTKNINKTYDFSNISAVSTLNLELENIMFTGNFFNPQETHFSALYKEKK
ncbi:hypothetical protein [Lacinutrix chionoecetis]